MAGQTFKRRPQHKHHVVCTELFHAIGSVGKHTGDRRFVAAFLLGPWNKYITVDVWKMISVWLSVWLSEAESDQWLRNLNPGAARLSCAM
jgi:hypothetical protein